jgi:hypothetical protein
MPNSLEDGLSENCLLACALKFDENVARFCPSRYPNPLGDSKPFTKHRIYIPLIS